VTRLIDSHILLWAAIDDPRLRGDTRKAYVDPENLPMVSVATLWELGSKHALGKLPLPVPARDFFAREIATRGYRVLDVQRAHAERAAELPYPDPGHRDPCGYEAISAAGRFKGWLDEFNHGGDHAVAGSWVGFVHDDVAARLGARPSV
jgi:PIN domain nuclease of toxin-antitoxin system